ncbi:bifunctional ADP-dependent NAD(P)H-hydrate dehydratase/NAD(P)H-hydrate epimerase, partial [bacterium]|nr:bifunctional ADP-dependent NAD(P)H-hydrate dehydratase/NAD(P)H-hydrate epimerase [bacterium]
MIKVVSVAAMREIEAEADASVLSYEAMMARAGAATAQQAQSMIADLETPRITLLIGKGNNGGDGLVAAISL